MTGFQFWRGSVAVTGVPFRPQQVQYTLFSGITGERAVDMVP